MNTNETLQTIKARRSVRSFSKEPIKRETLDTLLQMATYAPSPLNNQPWRFFVLENRETIGEIAQMVDRKTAAIEDKIEKCQLSDYLQYRNNATFFKDAAAVIIVTFKPMVSDAKGHLWGVPGFFANERDARGDIMSIGAACQNIMLAAESLNLGSCLMLYPLIADEEVAKLLDIRSPWKISAYIPLGYKTATQSTIPKRRDLRKIVDYI